MPQVKLNLITYQYYNHNSPKFYCSLILIVGVVVVPQLIHCLCDLYGWNIALGMCSTLGIIIVLLACLMRPLAIEVSGPNEIDSFVKMEGNSENSAQEYRHMGSSNDRVCEKGNTINIYNLNSRRNSSMLDTTKAINQSDLKTERKVSTNHLLCSIEEGSTLSLAPMNTRRHSMSLRPMANNNVFYQKSTSNLDVVSASNTQISNMRKLSSQFSNTLTIPEESLSACNGARISTIENNASLATRRTSTIVLSAVDIECIDIISTQSRNCSISIENADEVHMGCFAPIKTVLMDMVDVDCMKNKIFILILLSSFLAFLGQPTIFIFLPGIMTYASSIDPWMASLSISVVGLSNIFGNIGSGFLGDLKILTPACLISLSLFGTGICYVLLAFCNTTESYLIMCIMWGLVNCPFIVLTPILLVDLFGLEKLNSTYGIILLSRGIASCIGPPIISVLFVVTQHYSTELYVSAGCFVMSSIVCGTMCFITNGFKVNLCLNGI